MAFPSPSLVPPSIQPYQFVYGINGGSYVAFGGISSNSSFQLQSMPSTSMPDVSSGDVQRALDQGEFAGVDVLPGRDITITQVVCPQLTLSGAKLTTAQAQLVDQTVQALGSVHFPAGGSEPFPLYWQLPSGLFACMARPRKFVCPFDINRAYVGAVVATSLFHATDPRWYAAPSKTATVGLPAPAGGATFNATFNLGFGGGGVGGILNVTNAGFFEMRPVLVITGPCTNPVVSNLSISGSPWIGVNIALNTGDTLTIDTDLQTIVYLAAGSTQGASRRNALMAGSTWWNLQPFSGPNGLGAANTIEFTTSDSSQVTGTLTVQSADAYLTI